MRVLMVEDDQVIAEGLKFSLEQEGYEVAWAGTVKDALKQLDGGADGQRPDICLLDLMLPDGSGYQVCRAIREKSRMPILFLTACDDEVNTVMALEQGADDYIAKPFRVRELLARMRAILRRTAEGAAGRDTVTVGACQVNVKTGKVYAGGREVALTAMEYRLLLVFLNNRGQNLTRQQILDSIWDGAGDFVNDNTLSVYIRRLRNKLGDGEENQLIKTVRGIGYRMER